MQYVTAAIIRKDDCFLIGQRPEGKKFDGLWEFPGGKIEPGETPKDCIIRECQEELAVTLAVDSLFTETEDQSIHISFFICHIAGGILTCKEHQALCWVTREELLSYSFCPIDKSVVLQLVE